MNILVTGASRGIGYELTKLLACNPNVRHVFALSRDKKKLSELRADNVKIFALPFSLEDDSSFEKIYQSILSVTEGLDAIVNNAGFLVNKSFAEITRKELEQVYNVNVFAPFRSIQSLLPLLGKKSHAHIVNIGSMGGVQGQSKFAGLSAYSSSKMAIAGLTECLAEEFKEKNISVNCLALGAVNTEMLAEAFPGYKAPLSAEQMAAYIADFTLKGHHYYNGKILPVALSTP